MYNPNEYETRIFNIISVDPDKYGTMSSYIRAVTNGFDYVNGRIMERKNNEFDIYFPTFLRDYKEMTMDEYKSKQREMRVECFKYLKREYGYKFFKIIDKDFTTYLRSSMVYADSLNGENLHIRACGFTVYQDGKVIDNDFKPALEFSIPFEALNLSKITPTDYTKAYNKYHPAKF